MKCSNPAGNWKLYM